jgi:hypothetical protein
MFSGKTYQFTSGNWTVKVEVADAEALTARALYQLFSRIKCDLWPFVLREDAQIEAVLVASANGDGKAIVTTATQKNGAGRAP